MPASGKKCLVARRIEVAGLEPPGYQQSAQKSGHGPSLHSPLSFAMPCHRSPGDAFCDPGKELAQQADLAQKTLRRVHASCVSVGFALRLRVITRGTFPASQECAEKPSSRGWPSSPSHLQGKVRSGTPRSCHFLRSAPSHIKDGQSSKA